MAIFSFCDSLVTDGKKTPKTLLKAYLTSQTITGLFLNCLMIQYNSKKICWLRNICYCLCNWGFTWGKSWKFVMRYWTLLVWLQLEKILPFPKTKKWVYHCKSIPLVFDAYCICREAYFHDDIILWWWTFYGATRSAWILKLKFFEMMLFAENKL